jgi:ActR/RegA family two-component response regulator
MPSGILKGDLMSNSKTLFNIAMILFLVLTAFGSIVTAVKAGMKN